VLNKPSKDRFDHVISEFIWWIKEHQIERAADLRRRRRTDKSDNVGHNEYCPGKSHSIDIGRDHGGSAPIGLNENRQLSAARQCLKTDCARTCEKVGHPQPG
jgi:hypothetical protein